MKTPLLKLALVTGIVTATSFFAQAQKFGDNLGNHTATKDLQMGDKTIFNAAGLTIGTAAFTNNTSIALQVNGLNKAVMITRVTNLAAVVAPLPGMIVYNLEDNKFYVYQGATIPSDPGAWVTFALAIMENTDGLLADPNANGYKLTTVGQQTVLKLAPASINTPGIVTIGAQTMAGAKTLAGDFTVGTTAITPAVLNPDGTELFPAVAAATANTVLNGTLTTTGNVVVGVAGTPPTTPGGTDGTAGTPASTTLNGALSVTGATVLQGSTGVDAAAVSTIKMTNVIAATAAEEQSYIVLDVDGNIKKGSFSGNSLAKYLAPIPLNASAGFDAEGNSGIELVLAVPGIVADDAIVVNFASADRATKFAGLTILSATATGVDQVTVTIADFRNPAVVGYAKPAIDGANLVITKYKAANIAAPQTDLPTPAVITPIAPAGS